MSWGAGTASRQDIVDTGRNSSRRDLVMSYTVASFGRSGSPGQGLNAGLRDIIPAGKGVSDRENIGLHFLKFRRDQVIGAELTFIHFLTDQDQQCRFACRLAVFPLYSCADAYNIRMRFLQSQKSLNGGNVNLLN